ncbi:MAG: tetratricopeptide repeat protein [Allosphingosinicella sp.]
MIHSVSRLALGAALALAGASVVATAPAFAKAPPAAAAAPAPRKYNLTKEERAAMGPVQKAIVAKDWAAAQAALPAAQAAATSADGRYVIGQFKLQIGIGTNNEAMQAEAVDALIASGGAEASELPALYRNQGALALRASPPNVAKAEAAFAKVVELNPTDTDAIVNLAKIKSDARKPQEAVALIDRAIAAKKAAGQPVDETWYKYALKLAYDNKLNAQAIRISRDLVAAYPTKENWRDALLIYRDDGNLDPAGRLDLLRLMRASKSLAGERDWYDYADAVNNAGFPGEAKAVLDEGVSLRMIDPKKQAFADLMRVATSRLAADRASLSADAARALASGTGTAVLKMGDAYYGYGDYAKAAEFYRAAMTKGGVDAGTAQLRLGMSLAQAGDRAGAETALRAVTGQKADLAAYWLAWLAQRG